MSEVGIETRRRDSDAKLNPVQNTQASFNSFEKMSVTFSYADRISFREDLGGRLGDPELRDGDSDLDASAHLLADYIRRARKIMFFSGAGLSTACGIPDFRGPNGVWTVRAREADKGKSKGKKQVRPPAKKQKLAENGTASGSTSAPEAAVDPALAVPLPFVRPSFTHSFIAHLIHHGLNGEPKEIHVTSQNVDGLHYRSGVPRDRLSELHGSVFVEYCPRCKTEYHRDFELETVGHRNTGRSCEREGCRGRLRDSVLDWEQALPDSEVDKSIAFAREADLVICLGSSLRIVPAADIPFMMRYDFPAKYVGEKAPKGSKKAAMGTGVEAVAVGDQEEATGTLEGAKMESVSAEDEPEAKQELNETTEVAEQPNPPAEPPSSGHIAIINLQETPKDKLADLRIFGECDRVFRLIASDLGLSLPDYVRRDSWTLSCAWRAVASKDKTSWDHYFDFAIWSGSGLGLPVANVGGVMATMVVASEEGMEAQKASVSAYDEPFTGTMLVKKAISSAFPDMEVAVKLLKGSADPGRERWKVRLTGSGAELKLEDGGQGSVKELTMNEDKATGDKSWIAKIEAVTQVQSFQ